jgi:hypothetical protein
VVLGNSFALNSKIDCKPDTWSAHAVLSHNRSPRPREPVAKPFRPRDLLHVVECCLVKDEEGHNPSAGDLPSAAKRTGS